MSSLFFGNTNEIAILGPLLIEQLNKDNKSKTASHWRIKREQKMDFRRYWRCVSTEWDISHQAILRRNYTPYVAHPLHYTSLWLLRILLDHWTQNHKQAQDRGNTKYINKKLWGLKGRRRTIWWQLWTSHLGRILFRVRLVPAAASRLLIRLLNARRVHELLMTVFVFKARAIFFFFSHLFFLHDLKTYRKLERFDRQFTGALP